MPTVAVTRLIDAPLVCVWRVFTDLPARSGWLSTVDAVQVLTPGPFAAGVRWRETRLMPDGTPVTEDFHVERVTPGHRFTVSSPGIGAHYRTTYTFTSAKVGRHRGRTLVTVVQETDPTGPYGRLLAVVFGGLAARTLEGALRQDLADLAAAAVAGGDPAEVA